MNTESTQADGELFDTDTAQPEGTPDSLEASDEAENVENTDEAKAESKDTAALNRKKQIATFKRRVEDGEMTLDEIPHEWIKKALVAEAKPKEDIGETVKKAIQAEKEAERYSEQRARLNELGLSEEKRQRVAEEYKDLVDSGLSKAKALDKAIKIAGIRLETPDRFAARIPKPSTRKVEAGDEIKSKIEEGEFPSDVPVEKRMEHWEKLRKGR